MSEEPVQRYIHSSGVDNAATVPRKGKLNLINVSG